MGDVLFNFKPVDKTIAVKYPHFLNHSLMMSAEITEWVTYKNGHGFSQRERRDHWLELNK
jgi:hypothetical protein